MGPAFEHASLVQEPLPAGTWVHRSVDCPGWVRSLAEAVVVETSAAVRTAFAGVACLADYPTASYPDHPLMVQLLALVPAVVVACYSFAAASEQ